MKILTLALLAAGTLAWTGEAQAQSTNPIRPATQAAATRASTASTPQTAAQRLVAADAKARSRNAPTQTLTPEQAANQAQRRQLAATIQAHRAANLRRAQLSRAAALGISPQAVAARIQRAQASAAARAAASTRAPAAVRVRGAASGPIVRPRAAQQTAPATRRSAPSAAPIRRAAPQPAPAAAQRPAPQSASGQRPARGDG